MTELAKRPALCAALFAMVVCIFLGVTGISSRPLFPVDETRYMTVAWEMFSHHEWLLPTLNFEAYSHKPPLLFWLIMTAWSIFGVSQEAGMIIPFVIAFLVTLALIRMVRVMVPENLTLPLLTAALYLGSLPFVLYSQMIMFDMLLGIFVVLGITAIWQFAKTGQWKHVFIFALCIGFGVLAKGPVILLHLLFPVVLAALWIPKEQRVMGWGKWSGAFILAVLIGAAIALSWAIPAAIKGGPEFSEKIFWGQTAGRMTNSFDHSHPVWWYLPFIFLFILPWAFHTATWQGLKDLRLAGLETRQKLRFLACWLIPVFVGFSLISGKQVHYLLPLLPGVILLFSLALDRMQSISSPRQAIAAIVICAILTLIPAALTLDGAASQKYFEDHMHLQGSFDKFSVPLALGGAAVIAVIGFICARRSLQGQIIGITLAMMVFIGCFQIQAKRSFYMNYDLSPIGAVVQKLPHDAPLAFVRNYHGEWGFLARLDRPVKQIDIGGIDTWFQDNPDGVAFIRTRRPEEFKAYDVIYSQPYKMTNTYAVIVPRGKGPRLKHPLQTFDN